MADSVIIVSLHLVIPFISMINTLAYFTNESMTETKSFIFSTTGPLSRCPTISEVMLTTKNEKKNEVFGKKHFFLGI